MDRFVKENSACRFAAPLQIADACCARLDLELAHLHSHGCAVHLAVYHSLCLGASESLCRLSLGPGELVD